MFRSIFTFNVVTSRPVANVKNDSNTCISWENLYNIIYLFYGKQRGIHTFRAKHYPSHIYVRGVLPQRTKSPRCRIKRVLLLPRSTAGIRFCSQIYFGNAAAPDGRHWDEFPLISRYAPLEHENLNYVIIHGDIFKRRVA